MIRCEFPWWSDTDLSHVWVAEIILKNEKSVRLVRWPLPLYDWRVKIENNTT